MTIRRNHRAANTTRKIIATPAPPESNAKYRYASGATARVIRSPLSTIVAPATPQQHLNGKIKGRIVVASDATEEAIKAEATEAAKADLAGKTIVKMVVVPGRLVNIVVK